MSCPDWSAIAMALGGFCGTSSHDLWEDTCERLQHQLPDPYLQRAFSYLLLAARYNQDENWYDRYKDLLYDEVHL